ncbi:thioredoxin family protein [Alteromonas gracilis]|uniref:thioredoxin family protein n=1 Tax=Alteromonas gracilis TaxID=1479524 RepID=UPI0037371095
MSTQDTSPYSYTPSVSPYQDVVNAQQKAVQQNNLLLVVLGAQWCHDSTGLAERFATKEMDLILSAHYEVVFVDVGTLKDRRNITERFNYPIYYATPTVMIVEPNSSALLNRATMDIWGHADSIPLSEYMHYFSRFPAMTQAEKVPLINWAATNEEIAYNKEQAARLQSAYDKLGPLLAQDLAGNSPEGLNALWKETKGFRTELQKTLVKRAELTLDAENADDVKTAPLLRHYNPFSWEHN